MSQSRVIVFSCDAMVYEDIKYLLKTSPRFAELFGKARVRPPGSEDPLEKKMATHSSILAWKIP